MNGSDETAALITLLTNTSRRWSQIADDVEDAGSAITVLGREHPADLFSEGDPTAAARADLVAWEADGIHLVSLLDRDYPQQLLGIHQRPAFISYMGTLRPEADRRGVAIVGTRSPSDAGLARARELASGLAERGVTVVSGLAAGIDTAAHTGALEAGGRTVAVIGTGLQRVYPAANRALQERIAHDHLVLSQFWPASPPTKTSFPMRNAVMSGFASATVVIEAAWRSGARMQARLALEHNRPVFLVRSLLDHDWAREYVARGAIVVDTPDDVLAALDSQYDGASLAW